jgi:phosphoribosylformimino-5-aminoimidazole carboxamide ribotide isomerase
MILLPAVDIKSGRCVRLIQGKKEKETVYSEHPSFMAKKCEEMGAEYLHLVDLDGAFDGTPKNFKTIKEIVSSVGIPVELGGGIRSLPIIDDYLSVGIDRLVLGTAAFEDPVFLEEACRNFPGKIVLGMDARDGYIAVKGWTEVTAKRVKDIVKEFENMGIRAIIYTDIAKDGMMSGPNIRAIKDLARFTRIPIIASGGVSTLRNIEEIIGLKEETIEGIIIGKALYEGNIDFKEALAIVKGEQRKNAV